jgi:outer membrane protein TolC
LTYSVTWQPPLDGRRNARIDAAQSGVEVARTRQLESRAELRAELREVYAAWAVATEREAIVAGQLDRLRMLVRGTGERARVGDESGLVARRFSLAAIGAAGGNPVGCTCLARGHATRCGASPPGAAG